MKAAVELFQMHAEKGEFTDAAGNPVRLPEAERLAKEPRGEVTNGCQILFRKRCGVAQVIEKTNPPLKSIDKKCKMKKSILFLLCMAVMIACNRVNDDAYAFIESVYSNYGSDESTFAFNGPGADTLFAPTLLHLIRLDQQRAQGEVGYLDADPICACQDSRGLRVDRIRIKSRSDTTIAEVSIRFDIRWRQTFGR